MMISLHSYSPSTSFYNTLRSLQSAWSTIISRQDHRFGTSAPWCVLIPSINFGVNISGEKHSHYKKGMVLPYETVGFNHLSGIFHLYRHFHISSYWKIRVETKENFVGKTCLRLRNFTECYCELCFPLKVSAHASLIRFNPKFHPTTVLQEKIRIVHN